MKDTGHEESRPGQEEREMSNILRRFGAEGTNFPQYQTRKEEDKPMVIPDKLQQSKPHSDLKETVISPDAKFEGTLKFKDSLRIDGYFEGQIDSEGTLFVGRTGVVKAEVTVGNIIVEGKIEGNVSCRDKIELRSTAKMFGDIKAARLTIAEGVNIVGKCSVSSEKISEAPRQEKPPRPDIRKGRESLKDEKAESTL